MGQVGAGQVGVGQVGAGQVAALRYRLFSRIAHRCGGVGAKQDWAAVAENLDCSWFVGCGRHGYLSPSCLANTSSDTE